MTLNGRFVHSRGFRFVMSAIGCFKTFIFLAGMSEKVGPQTFFRCLPAQACAEDHQISAHAKGNSFIFYETTDLILISWYIFICYKKNT